MPRARHLLPIASLAALVPAAHADTVGLYDFSYIRAQSGLSARLTTTAATTGSLIGAYDEISNPTGTRTKPGLFGTFGSTENVPVPLALSAGINDRPIDTDTAGAFRLVVDKNQGTLAISDYLADFLSDGPSAVPVTVSLDPDSFRTRNPSSTYIGIPITLPIGEASLTALRATQVGTGGGTITPNGDGSYAFTLAMLVNLEASFTLLDQTFTLPPGTPVPLGLTGTITFTASGGSEITGVTPIDLTQSANPALAIPEFPLALPTILPPGLTADVLLNLTLDQINASLVGSLTTRASGTLVPAPGAASLLVLGGLLASRRRR